MVGLFALLGFFCVPLGRKTGFEHIKAIADSAPAKEALAGLTEAALWARARALQVLTGNPPDSDKHPPRPTPEQDQPKPEVPRLGSK